MEKVNQVIRFPSEMVHNLRAGAQQVDKLWLEAGRSDLDMGRKSKRIEKMIEKISYHTNGKMGNRRKKSAKRRWKFSMLGDWKSEKSSVPR